MPADAPEAAPHGGVEVRPDGDVASIRLWGEVDLAVRLAATTELRRLPDAATVVEVDCRNVTFMDSTGLSVLVRVLRDADAEGRSVRFLGAAPQVRDLLAATGVDRWMESLGVHAGE
jgi:anti-sigma B factor antagonist